MTTHWLIGEKPNSDPQDTPCSVKLIPPTSPEESGDQQLHQQTNSAKATSKIVVFNPPSVKINEPTSPSSSFSQGDEVMDLFTCSRIAVSSTALNCHQDVEASESTMVGLLVNQSVVSTNCEVECEKSCLKESQCCKNAFQTHDEKNCDDENYGEVKAVAGERTLEAGSDSSSGSPRLHQQAPLQELPDNPSGHQGQSTVPPATTEDGLPNRFILISESEPLTGNGSTKPV